MTSPLAVVFALAAAVMFGLGNAIEHQVARTVPASRGVSVRVLGRLARSPKWLLGMVNDVGAFGFQAAALAFGGLLLVQPLLVCGLLVALALGARWSGRRLQRIEWLSAVALCVALATFLIEAAPDGGDAHASFGSWITVAGPVLVLIAVAIALATRVGGRARAALLGLSAGAMFGITSALAKTFVDQIQHGVPYTARHWEVYALATLSIVGILVIQNGFQSGSLGTSLPALEATEPIVAVLIGTVVLHEQINGRTMFDNVLIALAVVTMIVAVIALATEVGTRAEATEREIDLRGARPADEGRLSAGFELDYSDGAA
ncbi:MAG TPA: DMT family transporter [Acidimicrobiia bacterium]|nr:DMT family transporter [Acidimicrobiia bacterium]